jgi:hypothetical protein
LSIKLARLRSQVQIVDQQLTRLHIHLSNATMKLAATALAIYLSLAAALPAQVQERQDYVPCSGQGHTAQCCARNVFSVGGLDCPDRTSRWKRLPVDADQPKLQHRVRLPTRTTLARSAQTSASVLLAVSSRM